jgi:hypothetical protein
MRFQYYISDYEDCYKLETCFDRIRKYYEGLIKIEMHIIGSINENVDGYFYQMNNFITKQTWMHLS